MGSSIDATEELPSGLWVQTVSGYELKRPWRPLVVKKLNYIYVRHPDHNEASKVQLRSIKGTGWVFCSILSQYASNLAVRDNFRVKEQTLVIDFS